MKLTNLTNDQLKAAARHYATSGASFIVGAATSAVVLGYMQPEQLDRLLKSINEFADGFGKLLPVLLLIIPIIMGRSASQSASPAEQVRKVEEQVPGVVVTPVTSEGQAILKAATGVEKPVETPTATEPK